MCGSVMCTPVSASVNTDASGTVCHLPQMFSVARLELGEELQSYSAIVRVYYVLPRFNV